MTAADIWGGWKVRWGIKRNNYRIDPGLYAVGNPDDKSAVLVTANYKMTFDKLRKELRGLDLWILVLDTKGVNVWCAAGKGTFGTKELILRIRQTKISEIVTEKTLIIPQLGATGVSAPQIARITGFRVVFGPVRAKDIKKFLDVGMVADQEMRKVSFNTCQRLILTPMELVGTIKSSLLVFGVLFIFNLIFNGSFGIVDFYAYVGAVITGCVLTPLLLPLIPFRAFAAKGLILGLIWAFAVNWLNGWLSAFDLNLLRGDSLFITPTRDIRLFSDEFYRVFDLYIFLSGVKKEMRVAMPVLLTMGGLGAILLIVDCFINLYRGF